MMVLSKALIKESEENAVRSGIFTFRELMLRAGTAAADIISKHYVCAGKKIAVICGNGNNAGDGFVIASILFEIGAEVTVITPFGAPQTENAAYYYEKLYPVTKTDSFDGGFDIIIDALFGIGLNRELDKNTQSLINKINSEPCTRIAIDIPSGVESDSGKVMGAAINADLTITFIALKPCFLLPAGSDFCGEVVIADIGVKPNGYSYLTIEKPCFAPRKHNSHKGTFGTALLFCGSYGMAGAAILAARGALRSGVGIVRAVLCDGIYQAFTSAVPEAVCHPVKQTDAGTLSVINIDADDLLKGCDSVLFGCGVRNNKDTLNLLKEIILKTTVPLVIDADGINALCDCIDIIRNSKAPVVLTPHPGEMARLCSTSIAEIEGNRPAFASKFSVKYGCYLVLKGADTIVAEPSGTVYFNRTGNPGMSVGGSGDVLAGIVVSLLAQGIAVEDAVKAAVYLHGEAGDKAAARKGERAMLPSDIIEEL